MRKLCVVFLAVLVVAMPALAGDKAKCEGNGEDCMKKMSEKLAHKAWLGIEMDGTEDGHFRITKVIKDSPAAHAGFQKGDILLSMNGHDYSKDNMKAVKMQWSEVKPGSKAKYTVLRKGGKLELKAKLGSLPADYQKKYIQEHLTKFHQEG